MFLFAKKLTSYPGQPELDVEISGVLSKLSEEEMAIRIRSFGKLKHVLAQEREQIQRLQTVFGYARDVGSTLAVQIPKECRFWIFKWPCSWEDSYPFRDLSEGLLKFLDADKKYIDKLTA